VEGRGIATPPELLPKNTPAKGAAATGVATILGSVGVAVVVGGTIWGRGLVGGVVCEGGVRVPDPDGWGSGSDSTPCISVDADLPASSWFLFFILCFPLLDLATEEVGVLGGLVTPPVFSFFWGHEEELCPTILQVRQVFGA